MSRSSNEVMGLAAKAARGAGAPPAQAAQFGAAAAAHLGARREIDVLVAALSVLPDGPIMTLPLDIARIAETAQDGLATGVVAADDVPLVASYVAALPYLAWLGQRGTLALDLTKPAKRGTVQRIDLPDAIYREWCGLAARLLVPESDASRLSGAGAGLSDND